MTYFRASHYGKNYEIDTGEGPAGETPRFIILGAPLTCMMQVGKWSPMAIYIF